jgi:hypothetical protein
MRKCLDEGLLQSYFDGELSSQQMESATAHLASCLTCAAAARELEQETLLLTSALAAEFEANVPTERLRQRLDAAVLGMHVENPSAATKVTGVSSSFNSLTALFSFGSQRALGYASLVVVLAFAAILGVVKMKTSVPPVTPGNTVAAVGETPPNKTGATPAAAVFPPAPGPQVGGPSGSRTKRNITYVPRTVAKVVPVKLLPGERTYLQTIAKLDTTIQSEKKAMRPALQVEYERNLAVVDRAIAATRSAAKSNPNDPDAADFMFAAYQSKVDLLNTIADARVGGH